LGATVKDVKKFFARCGKVESVRLRSLPVAGCKINQHGNQKLVKKVCANKKILSENGESCNAYVVFDSIEDVMKAIKLNGEVSSYLFLFN
jgi:nucleolar protein 12